MITKPTQPDPADAKSHQPAARAPLALQAGLQAALVLAWRQGQSKKSMATVVM
jgi:hypothetical protein